MVKELTNSEARRFNHEYLEPEHALLGLIREREASMARWDLLGVTLEDVRARVSQMSEAEEYHV